MTLHQCPNGSSDHANGVVNGDDEALFGIGNAILSEATGDAQGNKGVSGGEVLAFEGNNEGLESENMFRGGKEGAS